MHVLRNKEKGLITLKPSTPEEFAELQEVAAKKQAGDMLTYGGRGGAGPNSPADQRMWLDFRVSDDLTLRLCGNTDEDDKAVRSVRDSIFFGGGGLIFVGHTGTDEESLSLDFTIEHCNLCELPVISLAECEWRTCDACAAKCNHEYVRGEVHGDVDLAVGEFCRMCGRGNHEANKGVEKMTTEGRHLEVEQKFGVSVWYQNLPPGFGPRQVVEAKRLARKLRRARARAF